MDPSGPILEFDHYLLVKRNRAETRRLIRLIRKLRKRPQINLATAGVLHADNNECCGEESWDSTVSRVSSMIK